MNDDDDKYDLTKYTYILRFDLPKNNYKWHVKVMD